MKLDARPLVLTGLTALLIAGAAPAAKTITQADARTAVKKAIDVKVAGLKAQFPTLKLVNPCTAEYNSAVAAAQAESTACLDANNPPAGSPLAAFNALTNAQLGAKCGSQTLDACVADVVAQQATFCARERAVSIAKAKSVLQRCCAPLSQQKADLEKQLADIKADINACLAK